MCGHLRVASILPLEKNFRAARNRKQQELADKCVLLFLRAGGAVSQAHISGAPLRGTVNSDSLAGGQVKDAKD